MLKRICFVAILVSFCFLLASCETISGAANGLEKDIENTCNNIAKAGKALKRADQRMQETLW